MTDTAPEVEAPSTSEPRGAAIVRVEGLRKSYRMGEETVEVLRGVDLSVRRGEFMAIEGRSGSGKSTLLHLLGLLDAPDAGRIFFRDEDLQQAGASGRSRVRNRQFGFVFQFYHLLPELNVVENTLLAAMVEHGWFAFRRRKTKLRERATELLESLGMGHRLRHRPNQLSGGERQRVAIARALMNEPAVLYADEPTGNLDAETGRQIMDVLEALHREKGQTIVMVTHDRTLARTADRSFVLDRGVLRKG